MLVKQLKLAAPSFIQYTHLKTVLHTAVVQKYKLHKI